jgi:hypothetical protein
MHAALRRPDGRPVQDILAAPTVAIVPSDDDRAISRRLAIAVFLTVLVLIVVVLAAQRIPHAKRPTIHHPTVITSTIVTTPKG